LAAFTMASEASTVAAKLRHSIIPSASAIPHSLRVVE
jgi:hypothetical protein